MTTSPASPSVRCASRVEPARALDLVAEELEPDRPLLHRAPQVDDAAAHREGARVLDERHARVAERDELRRERLALERRPLPDEVGRGSRTPRAAPSGARAPAPRRPPRGPRRRAGAAGRAPRADPSRGRGPGRGRRTAGPGRRGRAPPPARRGAARRGRTRDPPRARRPPPRRPRPRARCPLPPRSARASIPRAAPARPTTSASPRAASASTTRRHGEAPPSWSAGGFHGRGRHLRGGAGGPHGEKRHPAHGSPSPRPLRRDLGRAVARACRSIRQRARADPRRARMPGSNVMGRGEAAMLQRASPLRSLARPGWPRYTELGPRSSTFRQDSRSAKARRQRVHPARPRRVRRRARAMPRRADAVPAPAVLTSRGRRLADPAGARARLEATLARNPDELGALNDLAVTYLAEGRADAARQLLDEVVARGGAREQQAALLNLAAIYAQDGYQTAASRARRDGAGDRPLAARAALRARAARERARRPRAGARPGARGAAARRGRRRARGVRAVYAGGAAAPRGARSRRPAGTTRAAAARWRELRAGSFPALAAAADRRLDPRQDRSDGPAGRPPS